jgi:hypothetical protein
MTIYVVIGVFQGVVSDVRGFIDPGEAEMEVDRLKNEYNIEPGSEEESENSVNLHEVEVDARPVSMMVRRQIW